MDIEPPYSPYNETIDVDDTIYMSSRVYLISTITLGPVTYQFEGKNRSLPLQFFDMIEEDSPTIEILQCFDDDSFLPYMRA